MQPLRVLLENHHPIVRSALRALLERDSRIRVVGEASNGQEAIQLGQYQHLDVAILDVRVHSGRGTDVTRTLLSHQPHTRVLIFGPLTDESYVREAFKAGARGYVLSDVAQADLLRAVFVVASGGTFLSPIVSGKLIDDWTRETEMQRPALAERGKRLFSLLVEGRPEAEIAQILMIPEQQVQIECESVRNWLQRFGMDKALLCSPTTGL